MGLACLISLCPWLFGAEAEVEAEADPDVVEDSALTSFCSCLGSGFFSSLAGSDEPDAPGGLRSLGTSSEARSSPSSASTAIIWPTGILELPASD